MELTLQELITGIQNSRTHFFKHLKGLETDHWDWKPYAECKSIRETIIHLICDDIAAVESLQTGKEPDYEADMVKATELASSDTDVLISQLAASHKELCETLRTLVNQKSLDDTICVWGHNAKIAIGIPYFSSEDFYHAGQIAFIRMAIDPNWDYYTAVYSG